MPIGQSIRRLVQQTTTHAMPLGDRSKYTGKRERNADRGVPEKEAERRAWATVNKGDGGGKKSGSGRGAKTGHPAAHKCGKMGGEAASARPVAERRASARKAAATRKNNAEHHAHSRVPTVAVPAKTSRHGGRFDEEPWIPKMKRRML